MSWTHKRPAIFKLIDGAILEISQVRAAQQLADRDDLQTTAVSIFSRLDRGEL